MSSYSEKIRVEWKESDKKRDEGLTAPESVERFTDIRYGPNEKWNVLDVYRPKETEGKLPVIVNIHGGGWVYGDKELYQFYGMSLAERGFAVVNFTYRLAPEHKFPAQAEDINLVAEWMMKNGETYELDLKHIFLTGDSAGGHLAGLYSCICTNPAYAARYSFQVPKDFAPAAVALNCGIYVPVPAEGNQTVTEETQDRELTKALLPGGGTPEEAALINVTKYVTPDFPPVFLMTSIGDYCRPQAAYLEKALKDNNVPYVFKVYGSEEEPLDHVFHVNMREAAGQKCNDEECEFFGRYL